MSLSDGQRFSAYSLHSLYLGGCVPNDAALNVTVNLRLTSFDVYVDDSKCGAAREYVILTAPLPAGCQRFRLVCRYIMDFIFRTFPSFPTINRFRIPSELAEAWARLSEAPPGSDSCTFVCTIFCFVWCGIAACNKVFRNRPSWQLKISNKIAKKTLICLIIFHEPLYLEQHKWIRRKVYRIEYSF